MSGTGLLQRIGSLFSGSTASSSLRAAMQRGKPPEAARPSWKGFEHVREVLRDFEDDPRPLSLPTMLPVLRKTLGLDDFGEIMISAPMEDFPRVSRELPRMASAETQINWTGAHGLPLLRQSCSFVRSAAYNFTRLTGRPLDDAAILDYGCGYGRLARLMYYYTDPENFYGVDPWDRSIEICRADGLGDHFLQSDYLPELVAGAADRFRPDLCFLGVHASVRAGDHEGVRSLPPPHRR